MWARFEDIRRAWHEIDGKEKYFSQAWLVTNTKLTADAIRYAECMGLQAVSWEYPPGQNLPVLIEKAGLHPLPTLTGLTRGQKRRLMEKGIILCTELDHKALAELGITDSRANAVLEEMTELCRTMEKGQKQPGTTSLRP